MGSFPETYNDPTHLLTFPITLILYYVFKTIFIFPLFIDNLLNFFINIYCISSFYIQLSVNLSFPISMKCTKLQVIEKCDITLPWQQNFLDLKNLSQQRRAFALLNNGRKACSTVVPECKDTRESHTCQFFPIFSAIFAGPQFVEIQKFCYLGNVMTSPLSPARSNLLLTSIQLLSGFGTWFRAFIIDAQSIRMVIRNR